MATHQKVNGVLRDLGGPASLFFELPGDTARAKALIIADSKKSLSLFVRKEPVVIGTEYWYSHAVVEYLRSGKVVAFLPKKRSDGEHWDLTLDMIISRDEAIRRFGKSIRNKVGEDALVVHVEVEFKGR
jgi:hypothetical protein